MPLITSQQPLLKKRFFLGALSLLLFVGSFFFGLIFPLNASFASTPSLSEPQADSPLERVKLQLSAEHRFQFAGYYAAQIKGFYEQEGLNVEIIPNSGSQNATQTIIEGQADFAISDISLLLDPNRQKLINIVAPIFQHSHQALFSLKHQDLDSIYQLNYKKVALFSEEPNALTLLLMFKELKIKPNLIRNRHSLDISQINKTQSPAFGGSLSSLIHQQFQRHKKQRLQLNRFLPQHYGVDLYGDMLLTSNLKIQSNPAQVQAFKRASLKGWEYALEHPTKVIHYIQSYLNPNLTFEGLRKEAEAVRNSIDLVNFPLGHFDTGRLQYAQNLLRQHGFIHNPKTIENSQQTSRMASKQFTSKEIEWMQNHKQVQVAVDAHWAPLEFINEQGQFVGIAPKFLDYISHKTGIEFIPFTQLSWSESVTQMESGKLDMYSAVFYTDERSEYSLYTDPYLELPMVIATQRNEGFISNLNQLQNKTIAVVKDYASQANMQQHFPDIPLKLVSSPEEGLKLVSSGEAFGYIDNAAIITYYINKHHYTHLQISGETPFRSGIHMAVRKNWPELQSIINKVIENMPHAVRNDITDPWLKIAYPSMINWKTITWIIAPILFIVLLTSYYNLRLKRINRDLKETQQQLEETNRSLSGLSVTDHLTGVYNRKHLDKVITQEIERAHRYGQKFSIILMDLDYFKQVNDTHGHLIGDEVLITFSAWVNTVIRSSDTFGRWGGEEFLIICPNTTNDQAYHLAEKICSEVQLQSFPKSINQTVSIGISEFIKGQNAEQVLEHVDHALYRAKQNGRNRVVMA
ncbi:diguanylate cyclase [Thiomicrorhabdus indica]|uniref:transporter substrate-binding domain-containing diguanylate cyclase n=1 Tax=Thiomicrorhabdus indica TaxID=2267253 RepID=UPI00102DAA50|nr:diguanylate cyclase [Thiomicrorhabdus indica]